MPTLDIELEEGENHIVYYLIKEDSTTISEQRTKILYLDTKAPQINGLEEGKVYCEAVTFSVVEENLDLAIKQHSRVSKLKIQMEALLHHRRQVFRKLYYVIRQEMRHQFISQ